MEADAQALLGPEGLGELVDRGAAPAHVEAGDRAPLGEDGRRAAGGGGGQGPGGAPVVHGEAQAQRLAAVEVGRQKVAWALPDQATSVYRELTPLTTAVPPVW